MFIDIMLMVSVLCFRIRLYRTVIALIITLATAWLLNNPKQMSPIWTAPFLSSAANFEWGKGFRINESDCWHYKYLAAKDRDEYRFRKTTELTDFPQTSIGYVYFIIVAKYLFFWQGDIVAVELLQIAIHLFICALLFWMAQSWPEFVLYFLLYAANPIVLYFVTFPFYYSLQAVPGAFLAFYLCGQHHFRAWLLPAFVFLAFIFLARSTVVFAIGVFMLAMCFRERLGYALIAVALFASTVLMFRNSVEQNPWHTIYIGVGAYPNPYVTGLSDNNGYILFQQKTGEQLDVRFGGNFYETATLNRYTQITQSEYSRILRANPLLIVRNALVNFFQSFSLGYFVDYPLWVSYLSALVGFVFFCGLLYKRMYWWVAAIAFSGLSFTPYFPPIQAYMFGSYVLIVAAFVRLILQTDLGKRLHQKTRFDKENYSHEANHPVL